MRLSLSSSLRSNRWIRIAGIPKLPIGPRIHKITERLGLPLKSAVTYQIDEKWKILDLILSFHSGARLLLHIGLLARGAHEGNFPEVEISFGNNFGYCLE